ncbi:hypothetical protein LPN01_06220 [Sphingomonas sp. A2-49]|uniref:hypothetical protein n=1 Tax=Sphingomonas sp. A2-49 TaxID=1391375 RepID=UPI0021D1DDD3|nr:hypothetical protein [Sphingomonas sp. A2-49]MCU6453667.1 hypothetical protein [Sphingomonas sp. A2-49]
MRFVVRTFPAGPRPSPETRYGLFRPARITPNPATIASDARARASNNIARNSNKRDSALAGYSSGIGDPSMRMFETAASSMLAIAAQALVVGVIISTL